MTASAERSSFALRRTHRGGTVPVALRDAVIVTVSDGRHVGRGEASPIAGYSGVSIERCAVALDEAIGRLSAGFDADDPDGALAGLPEMPAPARAGLEVALRDLAARRAGVPVWSLLGGMSGSPIEVSRLLAPTDGTDMIGQARSAAMAGYPSLKLKLGPQGDARMVAAVRDTVGDRVTLSGDANGCWNGSDARTILETVAGAGIDWLEQPVSGIEAMRSLHASSPVPLAIDEDAVEPGAFDDPRCADICCVKLQACGGMDRMIERAERARLAGMKVVVGSTLEGPVGIAAALHAAAVISPDLPCGLATIADVSGIAESEWIRAGSMTPPGPVGLGESDISVYGASR